MKTINKNKPVPTGIKILSILYYIFSPIIILLGTSAIVGASFVGKLVSGIPILNLFAVKSLLIVFGIILLVLGIFGIFVGRSLWT